MLLITVTFFICYLHGFLVAGVRKTQEDTLKVFILSKYSACKNNKHQGEIECKIPTNTTYIYISEW